MSGISGGLDHWSPTVSFPWQSFIHAWPAHAQRPLLSPVTWYRFGNGFLSLSSDDPGLPKRFQELYRDCLTEPPQNDPAVVVGCEIRAPQSAGCTLIRFHDPEPLDQVAFVLAQFGDRGYVEIAIPQSGWRALTDVGTPTPSMVFADGIVLADPRRNWQRLIGNLAIHRLLRLQGNVLFFHAASVTIDGSGCLLVGPKGAGKTTLSLALAARGHGFYGDEITGVEVGSHAIVPFRRSTAVRPGPMAAAVRAAMDAAPAPLEQYPDGSSRHRVHVRDLFPQSVAGPAPLRYVVLLDGFAAPTTVKPIAPHPDWVGLVSPMGCSMWGRRPARRTMQLLSMLAGAECVRLCAPSPDDAASAIERLVRGER